MQRNMAGQTMILLNKILKPISKFLNHVAGQECQVCRSKMAQYQNYDHIPSFRCHDCYEVYLIRHVNEGSDWENYNGWERMAK